jgi:hypothetical protein
VGGRNCISATEQQTVRGLVALGVAHLGAAAAARAERLSRG